MKLYYSKGACSLAIRILLNEIGVAADYESVNLGTKKTESQQDFLAINPKGAVPTLVLENGEILTENAVIMSYLADHYQAINLLPPLSDFQRYRVLEWVNFVTTELHKGFGPIFNSRIPEDLKKDLFIPLLEAKFQKIDVHLQDKDYLCGKHLSLGDIYLFVVLRWAEAKLDIKALKHLAAYRLRLQDRQSFQNALSQEHLLGS